MSVILDGKEVATRIKNNVRERILKLLTHTPKLAIITLGDNDASKVYVRNKIKAAEEVGIKAQHYAFSKEAYEQSYYFYDCIEDIISQADGVILQLPVPEWCHDVKDIIEMIPPEKDVDGLTVTNMGKLQANIDCLEPCTPAGIIILLNEYFAYNLFKGKNAVVIGRSTLVGRPIAAMLMDNDMTVTICHSKTPKEELLRAFANADVVVSAAGVPNLITEEDALQFWKDNRHYICDSFEFKRGRIIVDVSINRDENGKLCGDFSEEFKQKYSAYYTPVPGGVGPMTVAMLMFNTFLAAKHNETINFSKRPIIRPEGGLTE